MDNVNGFYLNDVVEDSKGILGIVLDLNPNDIDYSIGVLFTDVDEDNGVFWCSAVNHLENKYGSVQIMKVTKVLKDSEKYNEFMKWYVEVFNNEDGDYEKVKCGKCKKILYRCEAFLNDKYLYTCNDCENEENPV